MEGMWQENLMQCPAACRGGRGARLLLPGALRGRAGLAAGRAQGSAAQSPEGRASTHTTAFFLLQPQPPLKAGRLFYPGRNKCRCPQSAKAA